MTDPADIKRKKYRTPKWKETNVAAYTIAQESKYLIVSNVPALGLEKELLKSFALYGEIEEYRHMDDQGDKFNDVYWLKFKDIAAARQAKSKLNKSSFFSNELKVKYGPEFETLEDTREKIEERRSTVLNKIKNAGKFYSNAPKKNDLEPWMSSDQAQFYHFTVDTVTGEQMVSLKPEYNPYPQQASQPIDQSQTHSNNTTTNNNNIPPPPPKVQGHNVPPPPAKRSSNVNIPPPPPVKQPINSNTVPPPPARENKMEQVSDERRGLKRDRASQAEYANKYGGNLSKEIPPNDSVSSSVMSIRSKLKKTNRLILPPSILAQLNEETEPSKKSDNSDDAPNKRRKL